MGFAEGIFPACGSPRKSVFPITEVNSLTDLHDKRNTTSVSVLMLHNGDCFLGTSSGVCPTSTLK